MKKCYCISALIFALIFWPSGLAAASTPEGITLTKSGSNYIINFSLPNYQLGAKNVDGEDFLQLNIPGYGITSEAGLPALPLVSFNLFIAYDEELPDFEVISSSSVEIILQDKIFPAQMPWEKNNPLEERPFTINRDYYNSTGKEDIPLLTVSEPFVIGGVKGVIITIYPFRYNPAEDKLTVINNAEIKLNLNYPVQPATGNSAVFNNFLDEVFINYEAEDDETLINYLIITAPQFETSLTPFVTHKEGKGFNVDVFNTNITGTTNSSIKNFIQSRYDDPLTRPEYVLLVGDIEHIPSWIGSGTGAPNTDLNYVQLEGADYFADAFIGRFSVTVSNQLENAINKSIFMEDYIGTLDKKNIFMASTDNWEISEGTHNYVIDNYFDPAGYINRKLYTHTYNATTQQLINELNDNQVFAIYSGHGSTYSWADGPALDQSQVSALVNTWYPFVYSFACVTGSYHINECFGETWLRTEHGAATFYGSSVNSYWDEDDVLEKKIFKAMFEDGLTRVTPMFDMGKIYLVNYYGGITGTTLRYLEMYNLMGDPSMPVVIQIPPDTTPPDAITDLTTVNPTSNSVTLNWTAPYDSTFGGIAAYDIRYSITNITNDTEFNNAQQYLLTGQSDTAGTPKSFTINNLEFNTTYYFAIKAMDIWDNRSDMSNVPFLSTFVAPEASFSTDSIHCIVLQNSSCTDSLIISNVTLENSTLDYSIQLTNNNVPEQVFLQIRGITHFDNANVYPSKTDPSNNFGMSIKGGGGPDLFGYEWIDSNEPQGPEYAWNDISSNPEAVQITNWQGNLDDGSTGPIPIGFNFDFYGDTFADIYVSTNGFLSFLPISSSYYFNDPIPLMDGPNSLICPFWDDLDGREQGTVYYLQQAEQFVVQYTNWQRFPVTGSLTFQVVIKPNNKIYFYYENLTGILNSNTVGIENQSGTDGLQIAYNASYLENQLAVKISADPEWLTLESYEGTIYNGNSAAIILNIVTEDLPLGDYSMDMLINTNDPNNSEVIIPVTMTVTNFTPVELALFTAEAANDEVTLKWQTSSETNNTGFEVERKHETEITNRNEWEKIAFIEGSGTTAETVNYLFNDKIEKPGTYLYRLKQIDFDGTFEYSNEIAVDVNGPSEFTLYQNYPNPFNPSTTIKFTLPVKTSLTISVYNSIGEKVAEAFSGELERGYHKINFDASLLSSGIYFYQLRAGNFVETKKMVLMK